MLLRSLGLLLTVSQWNQTTQLGSSVSPRHGELSLERKQCDGICQLVLTPDSAFQAGGTHSEAPLSPHLASQAPPL